MSGPGLLRLAGVARRDLRSIVEPYLAVLAERSNETVDPAVLDRGQALFVAGDALLQRPGSRRAGAP